MPLIAAALDTVTPEETINQFCHCAGPTLLGCDW